MLYTFICWEYVVLIVRVNGDGFVSGSVGVHVGVFMTGVILMPTLGNTVSSLHAASLYVGNKFFVCRDY